MDLSDEARSVLREGAEERQRGDLESFDQVAKFLERCESPVEQMLLAAFVRSAGSDAFAYRDTLYARLLSGFASPPYEGIFSVRAQVQAPIEITEQDEFSSGPTRNYRADLLLWLTRSFQHGPEGKWGLTVVEVDGHDFHERTKDQARRDRSRDRAMLAGGYKVLRFTGSEVFTEPYRCAEEIHRQLHLEAAATFESYRQRGMLEELLVGPPQSPPAGLRVVK